MNKYAGFWIRLLAGFLDFSIWCALFFPTTYLVKGKWLMTREDHLWGIFDPICGVFLAIIFAYLIIFEGIFSATPGKMILKLQVRNEYNKKISFVQSIFRNCLRLIDGLPVFNLLGIFSIILSENKQRFGDKIARTYVVYINKN